MLAQARQQSRAVHELPARILGEAIADLPQERRLATQPRGQAVRDAFDRLPIPGASRNRAFERIRRSVERGVENRRWHVQAFLARDPEEALLPGHALGVESTPEIEQKGAGRYDR